MRRLDDPGPQSGGRRPAPGRLALVQAFLNSHFDLEGERGADQLADAARVAAWMSRRGLPPGRVSRPDAERVVAFREALRAMTAEHVGSVRDPAAAAVLSTAAAPAAVSFDIDASGRSIPVAVGSGVPCLIGLVLAAVHEAQANDRWRRLKACPGPHCGWVFYDHSRNRSSNWCSMQVCGGRDKARAYRRRSRQH
jgi:predicted RNA-binding Zn ribbon-like protein